MWCVSSIIGIWPRFIEPKILSVSHRHIELNTQYQHLSGLKIAHFSDLHWSTESSARLAQRLLKKIQHAKPDLILFTGDFICRSEVSDPEGLIDFLNQFDAALGCYAVLGNHDYQDFISVNEEGDYDVKVPSPDSNIGQGFKRLFHSVSLTKKVTKRASQTVPHNALITILKKTPFHIIENKTVFIPYKNSGINLTGLGEYMAGRSHPHQAFMDFKNEFFGIVMSHNPDAFPSIKNFPWDILLAGHTHGGQINLPWIWSRFTQIENPQFKRGLRREGEKWISINRGIGSVMKFRWFAPPELTFLIFK